MHHTRNVGITALLLAALSLAGCGGSDNNDKNTSPSASPSPSSSATPAATGTRAQIELNWAARSRATLLTTSVPSSALSADILLQDPTGKQVRGRVNRRTTPEAYTERVQLTDTITPGQGTLTVTFYTQADAQGDVAATAQGSVVIPTSGPLPAVSVIGKVASVTVPRDQFLTALVPASLQYSVRDASGSLLAVSPGSLFWTQSGLLVQQADGSFLASTVGDTTATLTVDGVTSGPVPVHVTSDTQVAVTPSNVSLSPGAAQQFTAQVTGTRGGSTEVLWRVVEASGGQITKDGLYTAPLGRGTFHVEAQSVFDRARTAPRITIQVQSGSITGVID